MLLLTHLIVAACRGAVVLGAAVILLRAMPTASAASRHAVLRLALGAQLVLLLVPVVVPWRSLSVSLPTGAPMHAGPTIAASTSGTITTAFAILWLIVALAALARLVRDLVHQRRIALAARSLANPIVLDIAAEIGREMHLTRMPSLVTSTMIEGPATWGWRRPTIVVPSRAARWSLERWRVVLRHELAHVARRDAATGVVARIVVALLWFDPLVWICARRERAERERACDDAVVCSGTAASEYVQHVVAIVRDGRGVPAPGLALTPARGALEMRMLDALDPHRARRAVRRPTPAARAGLLSFGIAASIASLRPVGGASTIGHAAVGIVALRIDESGPCRGSIVLHQCAVLDSLGNIERMFRVVRDSRTPNGRIVVIAGAELNTRGLR